MVAKHRGLKAEVGAVLAGILLAACNEIPQDAAKPYAGKEDTKAYAGDLFKGDKDRYEKTLAARADRQNEYVRTRDFAAK